MVYNMYRENSSVRESDAIVDVSREGRYYDKKHPLIGLEIDISDAITRHTADIIVTYKGVESQPVYLGYFLLKEYNSEKEYPTFVFVHDGGWTSHMFFEDRETWEGDYLGYLARYYADSESAFPTEKSYCG